MDNFVRDEWSSLARDAWEAFQEKGRSVCVLEEREEHVNVLFYSRQTLRSMAEREAFRDVDFDPSDILEALDSYNPREEIVVFFRPEMEKAKRPFATRLRELGAKLMGRPAPKLAWVKTYAFDPPPPFAAVVATDADTDYSIEQLDEDLDMLIRFLRGLSG